MATPPFIPTFTSNTPLKAAAMNQLRDAVNFANKLPMCFTRQAINTTSCTNITWTQIAFDTVENDTDGGMNSSGTYICQTAGWWYVTANIAWPWGNPSTGSRGTRLVVNTLAIPGASLMAAAGTIVHGGMLSRVLHMNLGDQLQVQGYQDTGGSLSTVLNYQAAQGRSETSYLMLNMISADAVQL